MLTVRTCEFLLHRMQAGAHAPNAFHRHDMRARDAVERCQARVDAPVNRCRALGVPLRDRHRARTTTAFAAAQLGAGEAAVVCGTNTGKGELFALAAACSSSVRREAQPARCLSAGSWRAVGALSEKGWVATGCAVDARVRGLSTASRPSQPPAWR